MNFELTKRQEFVRKLVRRFVENEVAPIAAEIDQEHRFPRETIDKMGKLGMIPISSLLKKLPRRVPQQPRLLPATTLSVVGLFTLLAVRSRR